MYFIVAVACCIISLVLWLIFRDRKALHLNYLAIIYGSASIMWLIDVIFTAAKGEAPFSFEITDGWISLWTVLGGLFLWLVIAFIVNNNQQEPKVN